MIRGSVTASLIGYVLLMHVKEFGQLLIEISSLLEKISRGFYYERMKLSYLCTAEYVNLYSSRFTANTDECTDIVVRKCALRL